MNQRESFNKAAKLYNDTRPSYPDSVIDWIIDKTNILTTDKLLEIAPGTGQATTKFAERGYSIHCIELGDKLAEILLKNCSNYEVTVDVCPFEDWQNEGKQQYKFIYCATAFHWIDKDVRYRKPYDLLSNDGKLVLIWNVALDNDNPIIQKAYELLFDYYPEKKKNQAKKIDIKEERKQDILNSGLFKLDQYLDYKWTTKQKKDNFIKEFYTQSSYLSLGKLKQSELKLKLNKLFSELEDYVYSKISTTVYIASKLNKDNI